MVSSYGAGSYTESYCVYNQLNDKESYTDKLCYKLTIAVTVSGDGDSLLTTLPAFRIPQEYKTVFERNIKKHLPKTTDFTETYIQSILKDYNSDIKYFIEKNFSKYSFACILLVSLSLCDKCNNNTTLSKLNSPKPVETGYSVHIFQSGLSPSFSYSIKFPTSVKPKVVFSHANATTSIKHTIYYP